MCGRGRGRLPARAPGFPGRLRPADGAATGRRRSGGAPLLTHALAPAVHPALPPGEVRVADRGVWAYAPLALRVQAGGHAVRRVGARQLGACTPGRPCVRPGVRRPLAVKGRPRLRGLPALGAQAPRVSWVHPQPSPAWRARETLAALPEAGGPREVRARLGTPGVRPRPITPVPPRLAAAGGPAALAGRPCAGASQAHAAEGGVARPTGARGAEGTDGVRPRLPPGPQGHGPIRHPSTHRRGAAQLLGCAAGARRAEPQEAVRGLARQPCTPPSGGAARQEAAAQARPVHDHTPAGPASAGGTARAQRFTSCHSSKT